MKTKLSFAVLLVVLVVVGLAGPKVLQIRKLMASGAAMAEAPETISSATVREEKWRTTLTAIGSIATAQGVTVTPDIPGTVREIAFESGAVVAKDALLVKLDTSAEEAQLRAVEAQAELAQVTLKRTQALRKDNMVSQAELDTAEATLKQYGASADAIRATIAKKTIRVPFAGRLGIRQINLGQYLDTGKPIVSLQSLTPVYADFALPQQELGRLTKGMAVRVTTDAYPEKQFEGTLTAIDPDVDPATRSVSLQATFENAEQLLRPGMFARVEVLLPEERNVLTIPLTAILSAPYGDMVYVLEMAPATTNAPAHLVARQQLIRTGMARGDFVSVETGLKAGERVASSGIFKLRNMKPVVENQELAPKASEAPRPSDT
jgi:membrane fusion protein, multidrug efflux system